MPRPLEVKAARSRKRTTLPRPLAPASGEAAEARVVIIGAPSDLHRALTHPAIEAGRFVAVGTYPVDVEEGLGDTSRAEVEALFDQLSADGIVIAGPVGPSVSAWASDVAMAHGRAVWAVMPTEIPDGTVPVVVGAANAALLQITGERRSTFARGLKRAMDVTGSLVALVISAPVVLVLALLVRLESPGTPLFRHVRIGRGGRRFGCLKLRTMYQDAEAHLAADAALFAIYRENGYKIPESRDPRVTRLGRFLRRASLDELPQFWNVLVGDMALVGPRPVVPTELEQYPGARRRLLLSVRPGLTGAWAVSGRHSVSYPDRAEIELAYIRSWTLAADVSVLVRTFRAILSY